MQAFGITINKTTLPLIYLAGSIVGYLLMLESIVMFQHPIATRGITVILELGFVLLALPAILSHKSVVIPRKAALLTALWLISTFISTLLGDQPWAAMVRWFELLSNLITAFCLYLLISYKPQFIELLVKAIMVALILCLMAFSLYWYLLPNPVEHDWAGDIPLFTNIRHFGYIPTAALPLGYWLLETKVMAQKSKHGTLVYLTICWALVFWLGGRGTFLGVTTATILYCMISRQQIKWVIGSIISGLILSQLFIVDSPSLNLFRILDLFWNTDERDLNAISSSRMTIYIDSLIYWWNTAPFFGLGADGFRYIMPAIAGVENIAHPHSIIIQLLISYGIIGLLIPGYVFIILSWKVFHSENKLHKIFYLAFISSIILSMFDGILYHAYGLFITTVIAGISIFLAWPQDDHISSPTGFKKNKTRNLPLTTLLIFLILSTTVYYTLFINQLYHSKYACPDEKWINWNAKYPLYFSPTWTFQRYSTNDIERLKEIYISNKQPLCFSR